MTELNLSYSQYLELEKIALGAFSPLQGFMNEDDFRSVVANLRTVKGEPFTIPIVLDITIEEAKRLKGHPNVCLIYNEMEVGELYIESIFTCDKDEVSNKVYGTKAIEHPGVRFFKNGGDWFIGGPVRLTNRVQTRFSTYELMPIQVREIIKKNNWDTIAGFQTRNVPHRAHEYLQRVSLEHVDGLFLQPLVGRKKKGDYTPDAVIKGYQTLIHNFFPKNRFIFGILLTSMRYAGPREAIFHAIIRRNYGCTHFIIGRDHAGVDNYYGLYDAHELSRRFDGELGITILRLHGPFYCKKCSTIATLKTCPHVETNPGAISQISGSDMRSILAGGKEPPETLMRPEIIEALEGVPIFIDQEDQ